MEEVEDNKIQALRSNVGVEDGSHEKSSICGREDCNIM